MGLDMYLTAEMYVSGYPHSDDGERARYAELLDRTGLRDAADPETPSLTVSVTVAYWRKANAIHRWFVENVQDGEDECRPHYVSRDQLSDLRKECALALVAREQGNAERAEEALPTQEGFFFGATEYDEWYWQSLHDTIKQIDRALEHTPSRVDFEYRSSW